MANQVEHRKFSLTELDSNKNKFWNVTLFDNGDVESHYGRQGDAGQHKLWEGAGRSLLERKIREKEKKGYRENKTLDVCGTKTSHVNNSNLKIIASKQIRTDNPILQNLIDFFIKTNAHNIETATGGKISYDTSSAQFKTTQGIVVPEQVSRARDILSNLSIFVSNKDWDNPDCERKLNEYLSLIPRDFGRKRVTAISILPNMTVVQRENNILDGLESSFNDVQKNGVKKDITKKDDDPKIFDVDLKLITDQSIIDRINKKYESTKKGMHSCSHLKLKYVYALTIKFAKERFDKVSPIIGNVQELFHGTGAHNIISIFKSSFKVTPPSTAKITGKLYGLGVYGAPSSSKALNYSYGYWSGTRNTRCFMFLVDFCCGKVFTPNSYYGGPYPKSGYDSTWAKANVSGVINDEVIVYKDDRCNPTYLLEFNE